MKTFKFRLITEQGIFHAPSESFSVSFHDTGTMMSLWASDGMVDEVPVSSVDLFTGLHDKNGKEIYEGDLILVKMNIFSGSEQYISESIFCCRIGRIGAPEFYFVKLHWEDGEKNQVPCTQTLNERYGTLDCNYRDGKFEQISVPEQWSKNNFHGTKWKVSDYTSDIEIIGNIHQNPELLES